MKIQEKNINSKLISYGSFTLAVINCNAIFQLEPSYQNLACFDQNTSVSVNILRFGHFDVDK